MKKKSKKTILRENDEEVRQQALDRDDHECIMCGGNKNLNVHHVLDRSIREFRHDINNLTTLCAGCHKFRALSAHKNPLFFLQWMMDTRKEQYDRLVIMVAKLAIKELDIKGSDLLNVDEEE